MRSLSSILVIVLGILPAALGTHAFAVFMVILGILGWQEYGKLAVVGGIPFDALAFFLGGVSIVAFAVVALNGSDPKGMLLALTFATFAPVVSSLGRRMIGVFGSFQSMTFGALYLGLPVFSAILLRATPGDVSQNWFTHFATSFAWFGAAVPRGLALVLSVLIIVWLGDTVAYLGGSVFGRRRLAPRISPGKTIEGSVAGLVAAIVTGAIAFAAFGAGTWQFGTLLGFVVGVAGQLGDLTESLMKRQVGVKDSGTIIPGHGGILDRIDALLFALPAALLTIQATNWVEFR